MSLVTHFKAMLSCQHCGAISTAWIQSPLGDAGLTFEVGDCPGNELPQVDFDDSCLLVRRPAPGDPTRVLHSWTCEQCGKASFAEVVLAAGCVTAIDGVRLDPATLDRVHYMVDSLDDVIQTLTGRSIWTDAGVRAEWLAELRAALEAGKRW